MSPSRRLPGPVLLLAALALSAPSAQAQRRKLNGPLDVELLTQVGPFVLGAGGDVVYESGPRELHAARLEGGVPVLPFFESTSYVRGLLATPDGTRVVWHDLEGVFVAPADGSGPVVQLGALVQDEFVESFRLSPDGAWVVYEQVVYPSQGTAGLFSVPLDGSAPPAELSAGEPYTDFEITADSARVLFTNQAWLRSAPIEGGVEPVRLHPQNGGGRRIHSYAASPDGAHVVYRANYDAVGVIELYSVPADGSAPQTKISPPLVAGGNVLAFDVGPDSASVTYVADAVTDGLQGLYCVPLAGGPVTTIVPGTEGVALSDPRVAPDGLRVVYRALQAPALQYELHSAPTDGAGVSVLLSGSLAPEEDVGSDFALDGSSGRVVFRAERVVAHERVGRLCAAPLDGSAPAVPLSPALSGPSGVRSGGFRLGAERVAYLLDAGGPGPLELWSARLDGAGVSSRLHPALVPGGTVADFVLDASGLHALYRAEQDIADLIELFAVPLDGSAPPAVRSDNRERPTTVGDVYAFQCTLDGTRAVYRARQEDGASLLSVNLQGDPQPLDLGPDLVSGFLLTPDSQRAVYANVSDLWSVPLDASTAPILFGATPGRDLVGFAVSPDSSRVIHLTRTGFYGTPDTLYSSPVTGGGATVELNTPRAVNGTVSTWSVSPDSTRVVYLAVQDTPGTVELYSAPLAGGAAPVKLNDALPPGGNVNVPFFFSTVPLQISSDSTRVVYLADRTADQVFGLYSVPIAGGAAPAELHVLPGGGPRYDAYQISPDAKRILFLANPSGAESNELFSVPLDGSAPAVELSALPGLDRTVWSFLVSPDSAWVLYVADQDADEAFELYRVPLAGGAPPVRLTFHAAAPSAGLYPLAISPDSGTVLYQLFEEGAGRMGLFRVPLAGGTPVRLNGSFAYSALPAPSAPVQLDASARWVLFRTPIPVSPWSDLIVAPMNGLGEPRRVASPLAQVATAAAFRPGASALVYLADQDEPAAFELFVHELLTTQPGRHRVR